MYWDSSQKKKKKGMYWEKKVYCRLTHLFVLCLKTDILICVVKFVIIIKLLFDV